MTPVSGMVERSVLSGVPRGNCSQRRRHLYPAFPYPWYTKVTQEDADAIWAYLGTLDPVKNKGLITS